MSDAVLTGLEQYSFPQNDKKDGSEVKARDRKLVVLKVVLIVLCALLLFQAFLYMLVIPCMAPAKIFYKGNTNVSTSEINSAINSMNVKNWMQFSKSRAKDVICSIPGIEDAEVEKYFPDRVQIRIKEREPVAKIIVTGETGAMPIQIDRNGVLFPITASNAFTDISVPLVSGITVDKVQNDMRIPEKYRPLMEQIAYIRSLPQNYFAAISEIQVVQKEYGNYELILYPINSRVKVLADRSLKEDTLKYMMVVLDVVKSVEPDVYEVDLRYGSVAYRRKSE